MPQSKTFEIDQKGDITLIAFTNQSVSSLAGIQNISKQLSKFIDDKLPKKIIIIFDNITRYRPAVAQGFQNH